MNNFNIVTKTLPTQIGICGFKYSENLLTCYPFNFYILPFDKSTKFYSEVGTLGFLAKHNFDFNKWIYGGIGFISKSKVEEYKLDIEIEKERIKDIEKLHSHDK